MQVLKKIIKAGSVSEVSFDPLTDESLIDTDMVDGTVHVASDSYSQFFAYLKSVALSTDWAAFRAQWVEREQSGFATLSAPFGWSRAATP